MVGFGVLAFLYLACCLWCRFASVLFSTFHFQGVSLEHGWVLPTTAVTRKWWFFVVLVYTVDNSQSLPYYPRAAHTTPIKSHPSTLLSSVWTLIFGRLSLLPYVRQYGCVAIVSIKMCS